MAVAAVALAVISLLALHELYFAADELPPGGERPPVAIGEPLTTRLLVFCSDSVRAEPMLDPVIAPYFHEVAGRGVSGRLTVPGPSLTGISVTCFGTGVVPPLKTAMTNFVMEAWPDESVFSLAQERGHRIGYFGDNSWKLAFGDGAKWDHTYPFTDFYGEFPDDWYPADLDMLPDVERVVAEEPWNVLVVHFSTTDKIAHRYGATLTEKGSAHPSPYVRAIANIDRFSRKIHRLAGSDTTVFIISDHGCTVSGTHGSFEDITRETRWAAAGPGIRKVDGDVDIEASEIAPLWSRLLGTRSPRCAEAPLRPGLLELTDDEAREIHRVNYETRRTRVAAIAAAARVPWSTEDREPTPREADAVVARHRDMERELRAALDGRARRHLGWAVGFLLVGLVGIGAVWAQAAGGVRASTVLAAATAVGGIAGLQLARGWVYPWMRFWDATAAIEPFLAVILGAVIGLVVGRTASRFLPLQGASASLAVLALATTAMFPVVGWAFGPKVDTYVAIAAIGAGLLMADCRGHRQLAGLALGVALLGASTRLCDAWLQGAVETIYRVPDGAALAVAAGALFLAAAEWVRRQGGRRAWPAVAAAAATWGLGTWAHHVSSPDLGRATLFLFAAGTVLSWRAAVESPARVLLVMLQLVAVHRLFTTDANAVVLLPYAAACVMVARSARRATPGLLATLLLFDVAFWLAQGYRYKLSTFDMNTAFVVLEGALDLRVAFVCIALQHAVQTGLALGAALSRPDAATTRARRAILATAIVFVAVRVVTSFLSVPWFADEGWTFLRAVHVQFFEALKLSFVVVLFPALAVGAVASTRGVSPAPRDG